jgi:alkylhydroperoxidase family enzyme
MGHCEMLLAVAGLQEEAIRERTQRLASGDWSGFTPAERAAFAFARKQSREPWSITDADWKSLVEHFGTEPAVDVLWWCCRCHYMTRVADAFQLPLERENVFQPPPMPPAKPDEKKKNGP